jgi:hypothetical protein
MPEQSAITPLFRCICTWSKGDNYLHLSHFEEILGGKEGGYDEELLKKLRNAEVGASVHHHEAFNGDEMFTRVK